MKINTFAYIELFRCIGGACEDSCCIGWDVDIDKNTFEKYKKLADSEIQPLVQKNLFKNEWSHDIKVDYAKVKLKKNKWCPFLTSDKWCVIQKKIGEDHLSNVCKNFPRIYNCLNGNFYLTLTLSCPEAVRHLLTHKDPFKIIHMETNHKPQIVTFTHEDTKAKGLFAKVQQVNSEALKVIETSKSIEDLFNQLNAFLMTVADAHVKKRTYNKSGILKIGESFFSVLQADRKLKETRLEQYLSKEPVLGSQMEALIFNVIKKYFYNDAFQNLFPFTEANTFDKAYIWLVIRASMLFYGLNYYVDNPYTMDDVVSFVSAFSKGIEHHHDFKEKAIKMF